MSNEMCVWPINSRVLKVFEIEIKLWITYGVIIYKHSLGVLDALIIPSKQNLLFWFSFRFQNYSLSSAFSIQHGMRKKKQFYMTEIGCVQNSSKSVHIFFFINYSSFFTVLEPRNLSKSFVIRVWWLHRPFNSCILRCFW